VDVITETQRLSADPRRVDRAVRRSIRRRGHPRTAGGLSRLARDVQRRCPGARLGGGLDQHGNLLLTLDGIDMRALLAKADVPTPGSRSYAAALRTARQSWTLRRRPACRVTRRLLPHAARQHGRARRGATSRSRSTRAGPDDDGPGDNGDNPAVDTARAAR